MKSWYGAAMALTFVGGLGCGARVETTPLNAPPRPLAPRAAASVELYASTPPTRPHVDIALLRAEQVDVDSEGTTGLVRDLLGQAAKIGCDALFISGASERSSNAAGGGLALLDPGTRSLLGTCIAYLSGAQTDPGAPPRVAQPLLEPPAPTENPLFALPQATVKTADTPGR